MRERSEQLCSRRPRQEAIQRPSAVKGLHKRTDTHPRDTTQPRARTTCPARDDELPEGHEYKTNPGVCSQVVVTFGQRRQGPWGPRGLAALSPDLCAGYPRALSV